jgi:hypothetical protein
MNVRAETFSKICYDILYILKENHIEEREKNE